MTIVTILIIVALIALDQISKIWAVSALSTGHEILVWPNVFHLAYVENRGAAFGMFQNKQWFFIITTLIVITLMIFYYRKIPHQGLGKWAKVSFILIISGAVGNLIDRIFLHYVRDFLYFILIDFPVFNVADMFVVVGVGLLLLVILLSDHEKTSKREGTIE